MGTSKLKVAAVEAFQVRIGTAYPRVWSEPKQGKIASCVGRMRMEREGDLREGLFGIYYRESPAKAELVKVSMDRGASKADERGEHGAPWGKSLWTWMVTRGNRNKRLRIN